MKPDKSMYLKALMSVGELAGNTIMIGDNYQADIIPAKNIGMKTCLYDNKKTKEQLEADYRVENFKEIIELMESTDTSL